MKYIFFSFLLVFTCLSKAQVDPKDLSHAVKERLLRVPEFSFIKEEADKLGIKVYLFGGTASTFGHYVRWDLERERGDKKYQKERFDYDFTNIYRGNQDLDIVIDGTKKQALTLKKILKEKYPHFVGNKEAWEVRLLRVQIGGKSALLNDPDFLNQHTDTNSTGMIAIDDQSDDNFVFRDLFSWDEEESAFLKDISNARIKFLYSKTHNETTRYRKGKNPPVFAAVRYLAKLAQYELEGIEEDLDIIKKIIKKTDWSSIQSNAYLKYKLEEFGKKVLLNAPSSEYAWNLLEDTGLRKKLIEMDGDRIQKKGTLSWWMNKEPLRSKSIGLGRGKRAKDLFLSQMDKNGEIVLSHETSDFSAYENITRSSRGEANVFISRERIVGEGAMVEDGFYTKLGFKGAKGTNLTIRFKLNLKAREESDFIYNRNNGVVILKNKKAITLIQENINVTLKDFIKLVINGGVREQDLGLIEKMKRKFKRKVFEKNEIDEVVLYLMNPRVLNLISKKSWILYLLFKMEKSKHFDLLLKELVKNKKLHDKLLEYFFSQEVSVQYEEQLDFLINNLESKEHLIKHVLSKKHWEFKHFLIDEIIKKEREDEIFAIINYILPNKVNKNWFLQIGKLKNGDYHFWLIENVLSRPIWKNNGNLITKLLENDYRNDLPFNDQRDITTKLLILKHWRGHPDWYFWIEKMISSERNFDFFEHYIFKMLSKINVNWIEKILFSKDIKEHMKERLQSEFIKKNLHLLHRNRRIHIINRLLDNPLNVEGIIKHILTLPHMVDHPNLVKKAILKSQSHDDLLSLLKKILINKGWEKFPEILVILIEKTINTPLEDNIAEVLRLDHWRNHSDLIAFTGKENFTIQDIYLNSQRYDFVDFKNNRKKISSDDGKLYSGKKLYSTSGETALRCSDLLN